MEELTSFQDWLRQMVDGEAITQVDDYDAQNVISNVNDGMVYGEGLHHTGGYHIDFDDQVDKTIKIKC